MDNSLKNIDLFNASAALIFAELYSNIPVPITLNYQNLSSRIFSNDETISQEKNIEVFINTVTWLRKSGYIWLDAEGELDVYGALLSPKGLEVLTIIPESSVNGETIGDRLSSSEKNNTHENRATLVKTAISAGSQLL